MNRFPSSARAHSLRVIVYLGKMVVHGRFVNETTLRGLTASANEYWHPLHFFLLTCLCPKKSRGHDVVSRLQTFFQPEILDTAVTRALINCGMAPAYSFVMSMPCWSKNLLDSKLSFRNRSSSCLRRRRAMPSGMAH